MHILFFALLPPQTNSLDYGPRVGKTTESTGTVSPEAGRHGQEEPWLGRRRADPDNSSVVSFLGTVQISIIPDYGGCQSRCDASHRAAAGDYRTLGAAFAATPLAPPVILGAYFVGSLKGGWEADVCVWRVAGRGESGRGLPLSLCAYQAASGVNSSQTVTRSNLKR